MADQIYLATGQVIDRDTTEGVAGLLVEAWDSDPQRDQKLGEAKTDDYGRFSISLDLRRLKYETVPDPFFKVYRDEQLLESTESSVLWNANTQENVTIKIRTARKRAPGNDRINSNQVFKAVDFYQKSDFRGVLNDYRFKALTSVGVVTDILKNAFTNMDIEPVRVKGSREIDVVNQDVNVVRANLASKDIAVAEVAPYQLGLNRETLSISLLPKTLKPGQQVKLYEENGVVRYYSIVKTASTNTEVPAEVTRDIEKHEGELKDLRRELKTARDDSAKKEETIKSLQQQIEKLQKSQADVETIFKSENFRKLIAETNKPVRKTAPVKGRKKPE